MTVSPVHVGLGSAAAPKIKTAPAQPFKALLHLDEATTTRARPRALTQPTAQPTLQPLVFVPKNFTRAAPPADDVAPRASQRPPGAPRSAVVFTSSFPTRTISTTKTTAQPSVNIFDKAAAEYLAGKPPKARTSPPRVVLPQAAHVTPHTSPRPPTRPGSRSLPSLFVPTPKEAIPTTIVKQPLKNRRRPRSPSDASAGSHRCVTPKGAVAHSKVVVQENVVRRSVNLETGREEIEVLAARDLAVERFSKRPARNRSCQSGTRRSRRTHGAKSAHNAGDGARNFTRSCDTGTVAPPRNPPVAAPWPHRAAFLGSRLCHFPKSAWKNAVSRLRGGTGRPLGQPAIPNDYPLSTLGIRLQSAIRS